MSDRKLQIKRAALTVFARYGLRKTSMEDVAQEAGISRPALYQYFRNKDDLVGACFDLVTEDGFEQADAAAVHETSPAAKVTAFLVAYTTFYYRILFSAPHSDEILELKTRFGADKVAAARKRAAKRLNQLAGKPDGDETGIILAQAGEGLKMLAPDEATLVRRVTRLTQALLT
ncbi:MAG TPA: TetR/AcrR family transcriptional regulator [Aliiroseovarius sp.]|nr:TetR/AcrR family transcriptional regulator [Aliiroseovarius sp.]